MSLEEWMKAWQSQDAASLYGVDEAALQRALRQEQAKLQAERRLEGRIIYAASAFLVATMAFFLVTMVYDDDPRVGWDFAIPIVGGIAALLWGVALYVSHRAQALRERRFGESVREQLCRHIAQLDYQTKQAVRLAGVLVAALPPLIGATAIILAGWRINNEPFATEWPWIVGGIFVCVLGSAAGVWEQRRLMARELLPRKRRLEELLADLDARR